MTQDDDARDLRRGALVNLAGYGARALHPVLLAWVTLAENIVDAGATGTVAATNVFARHADGRWLMVLHHGSPVMG